MVWSGYIKLLTSINDPSVYGDECECICSEMTTPTVIQTLLDKFLITDSCQKFALYEKICYEHPTTPGLNLLALLVLVIVMIIKGNNSNNSIQKCLTDRHAA